MAENEPDQAVEAIIGSDAGSEDEQPRGGRRLWLAGAGAIVAVCAAGGFFAGRFLSSTQAAPGHPRAASAQAEPAEHPPDAETVYHYYDFEPITINLDEPRLARYVRATITLAYVPGHEQEVQQTVTAKLPELKNWLAVYLAGQTLDDVRGARSLNRVRREIREAFNDQLWPQQEPRIHHVLLKEFAVQ